MKRLMSLARSVFPVDLLCERLDFLEDAANQQPRFEVFKEIEIAQGFDLSFCLNTAPTSPGS